MSDVDVENGRPIAVGVDGSERSLDAVGWAAREAERRGVSLLIAHAFIWPLLNTPATFAGLGPVEGLRDHAKSLVADAVDAAKKAAPNVEVTTRIETAFPVWLLVEVSRTASLVVIGSRGLGPLGGLLAGATALDLSAHAYCPVVITHGLNRELSEEAPVLVGVDGSRESTAATGAALDFAASRSRPLLVVHVVQSRRRAAVPDTAYAKGKKIIRRSLTGWLDSYPDVRIEERVLGGHPVGVLADLSREAVLTVVGSRGRGGFMGMLLGSVSQSLCHHALSPLVIVPTNAGADPVQRGAGRDDAHAEARSGAE